MTTSSLPITYRILIVDDVPTVREALCWLLDNEPGFSVVGEAGDGLEALKKAIELSPSVVILDIELPGLDGYAVTQLLKQLPNPPVVILLSVYGDAQSRQRGKDAGSDGFIEKGTDWPDLLARVQNILTAGSSKT